MTKNYQARPANPPRANKSGEKSYEISPDAEAILKDKPLALPDDSYGSKGGALYQTDAGSNFSLEVVVFDTPSKLPVRGTKIEVDSRKIFSDRLGRALFPQLPAGPNTIKIGANGYIEKGGSFAPTPVHFEPTIIEVALDSDSTFALYTPGMQIVPGEVRVAGSTSQEFDIEAFVRENWKILTLAGGGILGVYIVGKKQKD